MKVLRTVSFEDLCHSNLPEPRTPYVIARFSQREGHRGCGRGGTCGRRGARAWYLWAEGGYGRVGGRTRVMGWRGRGR